MFILFLFCFEDFGPEGPEASTEKNVYCKTENGEGDINSLSPLNKIEGGKGKEMNEWL